MVGGPKTAGVAPGWKPPTAPRRGTGVRPVVLVSIDGLAGFYWADPRARMPTLRGLAERGVVAARTETVFPSTTWPSHVSLVTGVAPAGHGVVGNSVLNRATGSPEDLTGDPIYDAADLLRVSTVYDLAHARGVSTAAIDWPATRGAASLDFNLPFFKDQRVFETRTPAAVWAELASLGYPTGRQGEWAQLPKRFLKDAMVADLAAHVLRRHRPGFALIHFLCVDSLQHLHGPRSPEAYWAIEYVDGLIGRMLAALPTGALEDRTVLVVVSDHGFLPIEREVRINVRLRQLGLLRVDGEGRVAHADARFVMNHGAGYLYVLDGRDPRGIARTLVPELARIEGVRGAWAAADYGPLGIPTPADNPLAGDLVLEAEPGYSFVDEPTGEALVAPARYRGTHGHTPQHPDNGAFFLAVGPGIRRAGVIPAITTRDVAPTLAQLLGFEMEGRDGRVLTEVLA